MGSCETIWETGTKVLILEADEDTDLEDTIEQIKCTLLGCGYSAESLKDYFK